jgi:MoaA/NifB/PqqE/SkfB family radical SAM enzyme
MPEQLFQAILAQALDGVKSVELIGYGEPLLAPHFDRMLDSCLSKGIHVNFTTNGILLHDKSRLAKLIRLPVTITLSLEGTHPETHEFLRPYIKWSQVEKLLDSISCLRKEAGSESRFSLRFNFVPIKQNVCDLPDLVALAHKYNVERIQLLPLSGEDIFEKVKGQSLNRAPELVKKPLIRAKSLAEKYNIAFEIPYFMKTLSQARNPVLRFPITMMDYMRRNGIRGLLARLHRYFYPTYPDFIRSMCRLPWTDSYFASNGLVHPCCIMGGPIEDLQTMSWNEIWNGAQYRNLRRTIHSWNPTKVCRLCPFPMGINGGNDYNYLEFFRRYMELQLPINDPLVQFDSGFYGIEFHGDGSPSHNWMGKKGAIILPMQKNARFLRFRIIPRMPMPSINPGRCRINDGKWEPFDNSCSEITFPLKTIKSKILKVELEMESEFQASTEDTRLLGLAIHKILYLSH